MGGRRQEVKEKVKKSLYPNLVELYKYHPYHYSTFADHAGVTPELYLEALKGNEELTFKELSGVARLTNIPIGVITCPKLIMMNKINRKHQGMIKQQSEALHKIQYYQERGNSDAVRFMKYCGRENLVRLGQAFERDCASYCWYLGVQEEIDQVFLSVQAKEKKVKARGLTCH